MNSVWQALTRVKPITQMLSEQEALENGSQSNSPHSIERLQRCLSAVDLTMLGVGAIIGTGIFVLTGIAALKAGPAVIISLLLAGITCIFAGLCYAELSSRIPVAGSTYTYAYASLGEFCAWVIGWDLVLEYTIGAAAVARGWSGYVAQLAHSFSIVLPEWLCNSATEGSNLLAGLMIMAMTFLLGLGVKQSARVNTVIVSIKVAAILAVIFIGMWCVQPDRWLPFMPFGFQGVLTAAGMIFFAYIGFDTVSTAAEETLNPQRDLPIGIIASLSICMILYIAVAAVLTGMVSLDELNRSAPLAVAFAKRGMVWAESIVSLGAFAGLTSIVLVLLFSQPRIYFSMARDGLFFPWFAKIHPCHGTPWNATLLTGSVASLLAIYFPLETLAQMVNIGTLFAFVVVCASVLILRQTPADATVSVPLKTSLWFQRPVFRVLLLIACLIALVLAWRSNLLTAYYVILLALTGGIGYSLFRIHAHMIPSGDTHAGFNCPGLPWIPFLGIAGCIVMMTSLPIEAWVRLAVWFLVGSIIYASYGMHHSKLNGKLDEIRNPTC